MRYGVYRENGTMVEVMKLAHNEVEIVKTDIETGTEQKLTLTKQQLYMIERFLTLGVHSN